MKTTTKLGVAGATIILAAVLYHAASKPPTTAAPAGWNYCVDPSYYTRACEASPLSLRWSGGTPGTCPVIAICGAHTRPCIGADGITYAMMDQNGTRYYPRPQDSAGAFVQAQWDACYVQHVNVFGNNYPCNLVTHAPGGTQAPTVFTFDQLAPGPQKTAWGNLFHCFLTPTLLPLTVTPTAPAACPTCAPTCAVPTATRTRTPTVTLTPHIGPAPTRTDTPSAGPDFSPTP